MVFPLLRPTFFVFSWEKGKERSQRKEFLGARSGSGVQLAHLHSIGQHLVTWPTQVHRRLGYVVQLVSRRKRKSSLMNGEQSLPQHIS